MGVTTKVLPYVILFACAAGANAELVRCTSKDGRSSVIRRDKCDSPDDIRTPVTVKSATPTRPMGAGRASSPPDEAMAAYKAGEFARARELFEPLAQKGDPLAQIMMSDMFKNGRGVRPDNAASYKWARKAGDQGDPRGQTLVAAMMQAGKGTPHDDAGAPALRGGIRRLAVDRDGAPGKNGVLPIMYTASILMSNGTCRTNLG